ncbi:hypothetical protein Bbelb_243250 [Branchiostoma belcheri]|nr:hypothetical protein Bbelb_243250 [Branchiostoma belcheri]
MAGAALYFAPFDRRVAKFNGPPCSPNDLTVREFIEEMRSVFRLCNVQDDARIRSDIVMRQLGGMARREAQHLPAEDRQDVERLFQALLASFDDRTSHSDYLGQFYARDQLRDRTLRDRLIDGLRDDVVRRQLKREILGNNGVTYQQAKDSAMQLTGEWELGRQNTTRVQAAAWDEQEYENTYTSALGSNATSRVEKLLERTLEMLTINLQRTTQPASLPRQENNRCYNCGEEGHFARECTSENRQKIVCFNCGQEGHIARGCMSRPKQGTGNPSNRRAAPGQRSASDSGPEVDRVVRELRGDTARVDTKSSLTPSPWTTAARTMKDDLERVNCQKKAVERERDDLEEEFVVDEKGSQRGQPQLKHKGGSKTPYTALVEPAVNHNLNASLVVARSYVEVRNGKAPVRIANLSKQDVQIAYNTVVAELSVVELVPRIEDDISLERENDQKQKLGELLAKHKNAFSTGPYDVGHTTVLEHDIPTGDAAPIREPYRRIPPTLYQDVREQIQKLQDSGVPRGAGECEGLQFARLMSSGFWQVPVKEEDTEKTAFVTPWGAWEWERMPMGLASSPSTFQRVMMKCLGDQNLNFLLIYQDDILVYSDSFDSHLEKLEFVLTRLEQHGLKLKPSKCNLCQKEVRYLGHVVSEESVATDPDKIAVVRDWPVPATVKQLRSFLGFAGYYRRFVQGYAQIAACLHELVGGQGKAQNRTTLEGWSDKHRQAFDTLKQKLTSAPILTCPDYAKDMILYVDACDYGYGAVLSQVQEGVERVIAYASKGLGSSEKSPHNYSSFKLELAGLLWAICKKFKEHLYGVRFTVFTDNNPLAHLHNAKLGAVEQRWVAQMAAFDFDIKY